MHSNKLKGRLRFVSASPFPRRASSSIISRRETNKAIASESHPNDQFSSFFDFEDEFLDLKPSRELYVENQEEVVETQEESGVFMQELENYTDVEEFSLEKKDSIFEFENIHDSRGVILDDVESDSEVYGNYSDSEESNSGSIILNDKFCVFYDSDSKRCDNHKSEGSIFCNSHQTLGS